MPIEASPLSAGQQWAGFQGHKDTKSYKKAKGVDAKLFSPPDPVEPNTLSQTTQIQPLSISIQTEDAHTVSPPKKATT